MSWDIVLFNTKQKIQSIEELDENQLEPIDFKDILEDTFDEIVKDDNHRAIQGKDFVIEFFVSNEPASNIMLSLYGENGLYELIELSKCNHWQIFDTGIGEMIDLEKPENNGYESHSKYVEQIMNKR